MNQLKMKTAKTMLVLSLIAFLFPACSQNQTDSKNTQVSSAVQAPDIDIHTAVLYGNLKAVQQHIEAGSDLNSKEPMGGSTPLISAITFNHAEIASALIEAGADLEIQNNDGSSPLHVAAFFCRIELVQMLVDAKVDQSKKNNFGATALETISGPFAEIKPVYEMMQAQLGPLGLKLDLTEIEKNRPVVAEILK
ncbi:MAG: ankyrin repeat domain-containing protein [Bacteroidota bacterium]